MSEIDPYADPEVYMDELEEGCDYGLEYCLDPQCRDIEGCVSCDYMCGVGEFAPKKQTKELTGFIDFIELSGLFKELR